MTTQEASVTIIPGVGDKIAENLDRLGIRTITELLRWFPRDYLDASNPLPVSRLPYGRLAATEVTVVSSNARRSKARNIPMLEVVFEDGEGGRLLARWFHQSFLKEKLQPGSQWLLIGTAERFQGETVMMSPIIEDSPRVLAIYAQTKGVTSRMLRGYIDWCLKNADLGTGALPEAVRAAHGLCEQSDLLRTLHQPEKVEDVDNLKPQLAFEEVFWFFTRMALARTSVKVEKGIVIETDVEWLRRVVASLPFSLTDGQKPPIWDAAKDLAEGHPMTRLVNGDVGSGKTAVAALVAALVAKSGYQSVILAPTEILAKQHSQSIQGLLKVAGARVATYTASQKDDIEEADIIVGTHALLQEGVSLPRLALVVVDEQHRFGVKQRQVLRGQQELPPHLLSMTATPIPRTLALALYGDLEVSVLPEKPAGRLPIETQVIHPNQRAEMYKVVAEEIKAGHQAFVICPLIEEKPRKAAAEDGQFVILTEEEQEARSKKTVLAEVERLRKEFPELGTIEAIHGRLKGNQKREIMERMARGEINTLVATSVIEVGVDVPNATVMLIEGAEHFGLAQLHQFRGRVGRGAAQSYCFLCPTLRGEKIEQRMQALARTQSGFEVAEADLALRGPGELSGNVQSGLPDFRMASLTDLDFLRKVKGVVDEHIMKNPEFLREYAGAAYSNDWGSLE